MRTAKAVLAVLLSASLAAPASAQVRAAASIAGSALPRVSLAVPAVSLAPAAPGAVSWSALAAAPSFAPAAFAAASARLPPLAAAAVPAAAAAPVPSLAEAAPAAAAGTAQTAALSPAPALAPLRAQAAAALPETASIPAASLRTRWEGFWSGSSARAESAVDAAPEAAAAPASSSLARPAAAWRPLSRLAAAAVAAAPAAASAAPAHAHGAVSFLASAAPFLEAGGVLVGAYFLNRAIHAVLRRYAAKHDLDRQKSAAVRLVAGVAVWTAAAAAAMAVGGASHSTMTATLGAAGTIVTLGLKDSLGNLIQGVNFLLTRPFKIGSRVQIDDQVGTVSDANLSSVIVHKDDGSDVKIRHAALAAKPVIVFGPYAPDAAQLKLTMPARPRFQGAIGAVWKSLDRGFWLSAAAFAALTIAPHFVPFLASGVVATAARCALAGSTLWLTRRVSLALTAAVDHLAGVNSWSNEAKVISRLAVSLALWVVGGGAALRLAGVTWTALAASLGLTTLGVGFAANNFLGSMVQGGQVLFSKPFKVGDRVQIGTFAGAVEDMTLYHVVIKLDEGRHVLVPYAVVRDATLVVTPRKIGSE